jgi:hypothetical protein
VGVIWGLLKNGGTRMEESYKVKLIFVRLIVFGTVFCGDMFQGRHGVNLLIILQANLDRVIPKMILAFDLWGSRSRTRSLLIFPFITHLQPGRIYAINILIILAFSLSKKLRLKIKNAHFLSEVLHLTL